MSAPTLNQRRNDARAAAYRAGTAAEVIATMTGVRITIGERAWHVTYGAALHLLDALADAINEYERDLDVSG